MTASHPLLALLCLSLVACGHVAELPVDAATGMAPELPAPTPRLLPTINVAPARSWPPGTKPIAAMGTQVRAFATGLDHPRWIYVLPNGDVLVAESNGPARTGIGAPKEWAMAAVKKIAGAGVPSADRITLLRDRDGDGVAEERSVFLDQLHSPFGMALIGEAFYVANTDAVLRFPYREGQTRLTAPGTPVVPLPAGRHNQHWTRNLIADPAGERLYVAIGSASNIAEYGIEEEVGRAAVWEVHLPSGSHRVLASGLRNPVGMAWEPHTGALWVAVNARDGLGSDVPPDYMTAVRDGAFYGWPYSYFGQHLDTRVKPSRPDLVARALVPDYALGPHTASLGLSNAAGSALPRPFRSGMFVAQHGSWNRIPPSGYKVIFVPFEDGRPAGPPVDLLTGFLDADGNARGRPVGVAIDGRGALLVADDVGNVIWRVSAAGDD